MKPNPDYECARYELNFVDRHGKNLLSEALYPARFDEMAPAGLTAEAWAEWAMVHAVPPFVE